MKDICSVCKRAFESNAPSNCGNCNSSVCPECLNIYQNQCQECYFNGKNPQNQLK